MVSGWVNETHQRNTAESHHVTAHGARDKIALEKAQPDCLILWLRPSLRRAVLRSRRRSCWLRYSDTALGTMFPLWSGCEGNIGGVGRCVCASPSPLVARVCPHTRIHASLSHVIRCWRRRSASWRNRRYDPFMVRANPRVHSNPPYPLPRMLSESSDPRPSDPHGILGPLSVNALAHRNTAAYLGGDCDARRERDEVDGAGRRAADQREHDAADEVPRQAREIHGLG